ncbi:MAG: PIN domain-containing protein [Acidimicrobiia bacterium]|nr:PIN domain-containing protein [Acidimicrobiia bacterium]
MIVVDASAAVLGLVNDGDARALLSSESLVCPHLVDAEVVHALRAQVLRGQLKPDLGRLLVDRWSQLGVQRFGVVGLLHRVWELRENLSAYDATYVGVAEALGCAMLTADRRLARAPGPRCPITVVRT